MLFYTVEQLGPVQAFTPEGFLLCRNVPLARTGAQLYSEKEIPIKGDSNGRVIIDRPPEEVFRPATIASLNGKPIALDHPDEDVTPDNYQKHLVGVVMDPRQGKGIQDNRLYGDLMVYAPDAIKAIRDNELREVSVGYEAEYVEDGPGRGHQKNIVANHLALVREGRCGVSCRIGDSLPRHLLRFTDTAAHLPVMRRRTRKVIHLHL